MDKITCNVVLDLLPLYVDDVLSADSRALVEAHLESCESCRESLAAMRIPTVEEAPIDSEQEGVGAVATEQKNYDEAAPIRKLRKKLRTRKARTILATVLVIALLLSGGYYLAYFPETYIPYEDSGLTVEDGKLFASKNYACHYGYDLEDGKTEFIALTSNFASRHTKQKEDPWKYAVEDYGDDSDLFPAEEGGSTYSTQEVYYLAQGDFEWLEVRGAMSDDPEEYAKQIEELKKRSTLIWKRGE